MREKHTIENRETRVNLELRPRGGQARFLQAAESHGATNGIFEIKRTDLGVQLFAKSGVAGAGPGMALEAGLAGEGRKFSPDVMEKGSE